MAMVLEGRSAFTRGLMDVSTASALTAAILDLLVPCLLSHDALQPKKILTNRGWTDCNRGRRSCGGAHLEKETEPVPGEGLVGRVKDEEEEDEGVAREENAIGVVSLFF
jgi:hypothetical protein